MSKLKLFLRNQNIDWTNHSVSLVASIIGLFLAFQLEGYREKRNEDELAAKVLLSLKKELKDSRVILQTEIESISIWVECEKFKRIHSNPKNSSELIATQTEVDSLYGKIKSRFPPLELIKEGNNGVNIYSTPAQFYFILRDIPTNNWEAAKSSGALTFIDYEIVARLTEAYYWLNSKTYDENKKRDNNGVMINATGQDEEMPIHSNEMIKNYEIIKNDDVFKLRRLEGIIDLSSDSN